MAKGQIQLALLRGINVGGKNKLPMKELAAIFADAGCREVTTYLQSGNVVFTAESVEGLAEQVTAEIVSRFGLQVPVILRSAVAMRSIIAKNPFLKAGVPEELLHVYFLQCEAPGKAIIEALDQQRSTGDSFVVLEREIYLHLPNGVARTKLTNAWFDRQLGTISTMRNWRTTMTLAGFMGFQ